VFTGIVEEVGKVKETFSSGNGHIFSLYADSVIRDTAIGDSIALDGVCLTVTDIQRSSFTADVSPETLNRTTLSEIRSGDIINLERALRLGDRLGGHLVTGHIDDKGTVKEIDKGNGLVFHIQVSDSLARYIVHKGSVAVDGVSLTVASIQGRVFSMAIIPHTVNNTNFQNLKVGDTVNIECDMIGKYVEKMLVPYAQPGESGKGMTMDFLADHGIIS